MSDPIARLFEDHGFAVRVYGKDDGLWFLAKDVCECIETKNNRQALTRLDDDEKGVIIVDTLGGKQEMAIISESGLYSLVLSSRKPEAKKFKKWITSEVIPSIRASGGYLLGATDAERIENAKKTILWQREREEAKREYTAMTDALKSQAELSGFLAMAGDYAREADMLNMIIIGMKSAAWKRKLGLEKNAAIRDSMEEARLAQYKKLEQYNAMLISSGLPFETREGILKSYFNLNLKA